MSALSRPIPSWESLTVKKQIETEFKIPVAWRISQKYVDGPEEPLQLMRDNQDFRKAIFTAEELSITEDFTAVELLALMATGKLTAMQVTAAYCKRASVAQQLTSCLTETFFDKALERAKFLDEYIEREAKTIGPLHGLPISVKDGFNIKGIPSTLGFVSFLQNPTPTENSPLITMLLEQGAVLYVKTNIPQTLMTADSQNNIFGRTLNPYNRKLTAGGSSGGEGALVALRGSPLGIGTDIAGSIRIPSLCCGTYGFKPSVGRIPYGGQTSPFRAGFPSIEPAAGPLGNSLSDIAVLLSTIITASPWLHDPTAHAVRWRELPPLLPTARLTIGVLPEDPKFPLHPPVKRALTSAAELLRAAGHTVVDIPFATKTSISLGNEIAYQYFMMDQASPTMSYIQASGEPTIPSVEKNLHLSASNVEYVDLASIPEHNVKRAAYKKSWNDIFVGKKLDIVIAPGAQNTAVAHDMYGLPPYTAWVNVLDYPACMIPYSFVSKDVDQEYKINPPAVGPNFNPKELDGLPCAIQVVAPHFYDEELLRASRIVDTDLKRGS